jgi:hypothetical protein
MGRRKIVALTAGLVAVGAAATAAVVMIAGGGGARPADTARLQQDIARRLPPGWSGRVTADKGTVDVSLVYQGDVTSTIVSMRHNRIVNTDDSEIMKLLPSNAREGDYLIHIVDGKDKKDLVRARVGRQHQGPHPDLQFMSREFMQAQIDMASTATPSV